MSELIELESRDGELFACVDGTWKALSWIVLENYVIGSPVANTDDWQVMHLNGDPDDHRASNLAILSHEEAELVSQQLALFESMSETTEEEQARSARVFSRLADVINGLHSLNVRKIRSLVFLQANPNLVDQFATEHDWSTTRYEVVCEEII